MGPYEIHLEVYTWKKVLQHPFFFLLTKLCDGSVLLLAEIYSKFDRNAEVTPITNFFRPI
jgi:hypothetical protein